MKSSKLNHTQQRILDQMVRDGTPFPSDPRSTSAPPKRSPGSLLNLFSSRAQPRIPVQNRPRIRMLGQIVESGAFEMDTFTPKVSSKFLFFNSIKENMTLEKEKFQNKLMGEPDPSSVVERDYQNDKQQEEREVDEIKMRKF